MNCNISPIETVNPGVIPRTEFKSSHDDPFEYPGQPPEGSYTTDGYNVMLTEFVSDSVENGERKVRFSIFNPETGKNEDLDTYLDAKGLPLMEDRVPVIAYGANRNPASLFRKFDYAKEGDPSLLVVPVIQATRVGSDVVWSKNVGARGRQFADMVTNDDVSDTKIGIAVNFLTHDQLAIMHSTERQYDIIEQGEVELAGGVVIPGFYYSGTEGEAYKIGNSPVAVSAIPGKHRVGEEHTAESSLSTIIDRLHTAQTLPDRLNGNWQSAQEFMDYYALLETDEKRLLRLDLDKFLDENEMGYKHTRPIDARVHEWSTNSLPTMSVLLNGMGEQGVQGRLFTNDLIADLKKRAVVDDIIHRVAAGI